LEIDQDFGSTRSPQSTKYSSDRVNLRSPLFHHGCSTVGPKPGKSDFLITREFEKDCGSSDYLDPYQSKAFSALAVFPAQSSDRKDNFDNHTDRFPKFAGYVPLVLQPFHSFVPGLAVVPFALPRQSPEVDPR
jgi:hypothetical protein